ncbi:(2Fe-2S)-binding protein [Hyalangium rubrum]|uniref:(2Fe-2S)-binding protein n=1 Tax=Hyalangium rubrum TaxID=3103134 RepID=A0ABU5H611_9BACT|nr:(2Fe-2S)-binding protein [Hyalangium sp. s54d21]MDY7228923.1 (2Fe-2S)-binding protein [Hyalangium sp. s54d21]
MTPPDDDSDSKPLLPKLSRRAFFTGAGASALSATLAQSATAVAANASPAVVGPEPASLSLSINGRSVAVQADPATTLAEVLRNHLGMTGTKIGCDRGACSACTVWLDGEVAASCMTLAFDARGRKVTTIEGLAQGDELHPVQRAFVENDAMQCGFCTPGMVMSCAALVERNPKCTLDDVKQAVSGHLCRCGTYPNVFKATLAAAKAGGKGKGKS